MVDELARIAKARNASVASVALAWLLAQPGVTSPIIGARRLAQLEDNLSALDVTLTAEDLASLDALTRPAIGFHTTCCPWRRASRTAGRA